MVLDCESLPIARQKPVIRLSPRSQISDTQELDVRILGMVFDLIGAHRRWSTPVGFDVCILVDFGKVTVWTCSGLSLGMKSSPSRAGPHGDKVDLVLDTQSDTFDSS